MHRRRAALLPTPQRPLESIPGAVASFGQFSSVPNLPQAAPEPFPQDFSKRITLGFGQFVIRPTFPEESEAPSSVPDPWKEHLLEVYRRESSSMPATANSTSPTEAKLRAQFFTPALPSEDSHSAITAAFHASWEMLLRARRPEDITAARTAVSDNLDCLALQSRRASGNQVLPEESTNFPDCLEEPRPQSDFQGSIPAVLLTATEHLPRVGSPEGISGARIAAVAGLAHFQTGRSITG